MRAWKKRAVEHASAVAPLIRFITAKAAGSVKACALGQSCPALPAYRLKGATNNMILIGLTGGKPEQRKEIAERLERFGESRLQTWAGTDVRRAARLRDLVIALNDASSNKALGGIVACNVMTLEEAQEIRRRGGVIWHVMGAPSESVPMERNDPKVTHMQGGCRHFLDALDALAEHRLSITAD